MTRRPPRKGKGADIFLGEGDRPPVKRRCIPKGRGADVFLGEEPGPAQARTPKQPPRPPGPVTPPSAPANLVAGLDGLLPSLSPTHGRIDRSHLVVMLWLWAALQAARA